MENKKEILQEINCLKEKLNSIEKNLNSIEEKEETQYPIYCKSRQSGLVVKFTSEKEGVVVVNNNFHDVSYYSITFVNHKDTEHWKQLDVCPETGFFDGQAVWCWDNVDTHIRSLKFYDAKNRCVFFYDGKRHGILYENYKPYEGNYEPWMLESFKTLEF